MHQRYNHRFAWWDHLRYQNTLIEFEFSPPLCFCVNCFLWWYSFELCLQWICKDSWVGLSELKILLYIEYWSDAIRRPWLTILQGEDLGSGSQHLPNKPHNRPISLLPPITFPALALAAQTDPRPMVIQLPGRLPEMFHTVARLLTCQFGDYNVIYPLHQSEIVILWQRK